MRKLTIQLIPASAYGQNLRSLYPNEWKAISRYVRRNLTCSTCGKQVKRIGDLDAHEEWEWKKEKKHGKIRYRQRLVAIYPVCKACHRVIHIGRTKRELPPWEYLAAAERYRKINHVSYRQFIEDEEEAFRKYEKRSRHKWKLKITNDDLMRAYEPREENVCQRTP
jgi:hypothetical protein